MKALVAVKRVLDYNVKPRIKPDGSAMDLDNLKMSMNPFCEIAVEEAIRLKEKGVVSEVVVVTVGDKKSEEQLRTALALGADSAIRVDSEGEQSPLTIAKTLAAVAQKEAAELVIMGKQAIDGDNNQTGQMLAARLDWPQATFASEVSINEGKANVVREIDGGLETLAVTLPAVITTDLRLNEPRFAKLPDIMKAKRKPLAVLSFDELNIEPSNTVIVESIEPPAQRSGGRKVASVDELVDALKNEAKVIS
ncbi:electron transfer flavoprotein subunit beta/FixA family protein [Salinibius halmophilus]|uniref:electron transfer flavoprotein subunit beta/FixA family protein n=1 Tax=Salinibius halmophilus TaxID=1853216 RepID=UPI000E6735C8|nr:electron transfer flavoprotein subunit beta/FixA family protein [Salinibius halmophilus]